MEDRLRAGTPGTGAPSARLSVHVLATTAEGTRCPFTTAKRLTRGLPARIVLLVPRLASFGTPRDPTSNDPAVLIEQHKVSAASVGADVVVLFCVCRRHDDVVHWMLSHSSIVIVGGRQGIWWPSREERLVRRLTADGYPVVFAQVGAEDVLERLPVPSS